MDTSGFQEQDAYTSLVLVDRAGVGGTEIIYNAVRLVFKPGQTELIVPKFVTDWLFKYQKHMVWTEDGVYTNRFAVKNVSDDIAAVYGPEAVDLSPISIDGNRVEGWNTDEAGRSGAMRVVNVNVPSNLLKERQGSNAYSFATDNKEKK